VFGPARAVTFIPSGIGPFGAEILITKSMSIEQANFFSFLLYSKLLVWARNHSMSFGFGRKELSSARHIQYLPEFDVQPCVVAAMNTVSSCGRFKKIR
jgi:hypothetical protein